MEWDAMEWEEGKGKEIKRERERELDLTKHCYVTAMKFRLNSHIYFASGDSK